MSRPCISYVNICYIIIIIIIIIIVAVVAVVVNNNNNNANNNANNNNNGDNNNTKHDNNNDNNNNNNNNNNFPICNPRYRQNDVIHKFVKEYHGPSVLSCSAYTIDVRQDRILSAAKWENVQII